MNNAVHKLKIIPTPATIGEPDPGKNVWELLSVLHFNDGKAAIPE